MDNTQRPVWIRRDTGYAAFNVNFKDAIVFTYIADAFLVQISDFAHRIVLLSHKIILVDCCVLTPIYVTIMFTIVK